MADETQDLFEKLASKRRKKKPQADAQQTPEPEAEQHSESVEATIPLQGIKDRSGGNTRPLNSEHVQTLAESIGAVGLVQPIAVDNKGRLLAGGHRKAAIELLKEQSPTAYSHHFEGNRVPVRVFDFDSEQQVERALGIEVTENEQRRDYTAEEVQALYDRLLKAGYVDKAGRAKKGEKPVKPALQLIIGKSESTLRRMLRKPQPPKDKTLSSDRVSRNKHLKRAIASLKKWEATEPNDDDEQKLLSQLQSILKKLAQGISKDEGEN